MSSTQERGKGLLLRSTSQFMKNFAGANGIVGQAKSSATTAAVSLPQDKGKKEKQEQTDLTRIIQHLDLHMPRKQKPADPFAPYIDTLPKYLFNIKVVNLEHDNDFHITSSDETGPHTNSTAHNPFIPESHAKSISTYPHFPGNERQEGHPICDAYRVVSSRAGALCVLADGCGWGERAKIAAQRAIQTFTDYMGGRLSKIKDIRHASELLLKAFREAHIGVLDHAHGPDIRECFECTKTGTTTLLGGLLLPLESHAHTAEGRVSLPRWAFVCCSVGDCKAFVYSRKKITEVTVGSRSSLQDTSDCGGRLGPQLALGAPDLRNLQVFFTPVLEGDILLLCSDGVHDNFDPEHLGKSPRDVGLSAADWATVDPIDAVEVKDIYRARYLEDLLLGAKEPDEVVDKLLIHSKATTASSRFWMEQNKARLPHDYTRFPGKMDHTTCVAIKVPIQTYLEQEPKKS